MRPTPPPCPQLGPLPLVEKPGVQVCAASAPGPGLVGESKAVPHGFSPPRVSALYSSVWGPALSTPVASSLSKLGGYRLRLRQGAVSEWNWRTR